MKFIAAASLAFVGAVAAQNSTFAPLSGCALQENNCRTAPNANQAQCSANQAQCVGDCYKSYNTCRTTPVNGLSANQAECVSIYAGCLGQNPVSPTGGLSILPYTATASLTSSASPAEQTATCQKSYDTCRTSPDANFSFCASQYAACLGTNPFASNGTNTVTSANGGAVYTTQVVTALTTVCPAPTAGPYTTKLGNAVYTISSATTITVTDCPCTITKPVASATKSGMVPSGPASASGSASATTSKPAAFTGAAAHFGAGMGLLGAAAGAAMLL